MQYEGWRNTVGNLIEFAWLKKTYHGPQFTGICVKNRGVRFHRVRDFQQYYFNSIPPTCHIATTQQRTHGVNTNGVESVKFAIAIAIAIANPDLATIAIAIATTRQRTFMLM